MRNYFAALMCITLILGFSAEASSQRGLQEFGREQDIFVQYKWQRANFFDKESNAALTLRVTNESENFVEINFTISFYRNEQLMFQNSDNTLCLRPGQSRRGSPAGLRFMAEGISMDMIEEEWFSWDVSQMEVTIVETCN